MNLGSEEEKARLGVTAPHHFAAVCSCLRFRMTQLQFPACACQIGIPLSDAFPLGSQIPANYCFGSS